MKSWRKFSNLVAFRIRAFTVLIIQALTVSIAYAGGPDPRSLIGLEIAGVNYPNGWKQIGSDGFGSSSTILTTLKNGKHYAFTLERRTNLSKPGEKIKIIRSLVTDAILVSNPTSYHQFARRCYFDEKDADHGMIYAEVGFRRFCDMKTTLVKRAWRINVETGRFERIANTKGLTCEFGLISVGEPDFREGCPTYNWR